MKRSYTLKELALLVDGEIEGDPNFLVTNIAISPELAQINELVMVIEDKFLDISLKSQSKVLMISKNLKLNSIDKNLLKVSHTRLSMSKLLSIFFPISLPERKIHEKAVIEQSCKLGNNLSIGPNVYIGNNSYIKDNSIIYPNVYIGDNVSLGKECIIYPNVTIYHNCLIGDRVIIHSGTVIGSDGYGFAQTEEKKHIKIPQVGNVIIGDDVEIGANVTIDRGTIGSTIIKKGTKIDNLVHIGHNVEIGEDSLIIAMVGISGSCKIGDRVILAGQVGVAGHLKIGNDVIIAAKSGVTTSIPDKSKVSGFPARNHMEELRFQASLRKVPEILKELKYLKKQIKSIENQLSLNNEN